MNETYLTRQSDLIKDEQRNKSITIVGAGAIGSFTALALAKMGFTNITVYDFDTVEPENMNCQFFPTFAIGQPKATALQQMIQTFTGAEITVHNRAVTEDDVITGDYLICAVDSMEVRTMLFEDCWSTKWLIDPRMGAEYASMRVLNQDFPQSDHDAYNKSLYSDDEAVQERCTAKATMYTVLLIAGQIAKAVKDTATDNDFVESLEWNIEHNQLMAWGRNNGKL